MQTRMNDLLQNGWTLAIALGIRVLEALALWIVGRWLIGVATRLIGKAMTKQKRATWDVTFVIPATIVSGLSGVWLL